MNKFHWTAYDRLHFAARHLLENADRTQLKLNNNFWPAGTTLAAIEAILRQIIQAHEPEIVLPAAGQCGPGFALFEFNLNTGISVRVGINSNGRIVLAQPLDGPNVIHLNNEEAQRLFTVLPGVAQPARPARRAGTGKGRKKR